MSLRSAGYSTPLFEEYMQSSLSITFWGERLAFELPKSVGTFSLAIHLLDASSNETAQGDVDGVRISTLTKQEEGAEALPHPVFAAASGGTREGAYVAGESGVGHPFSGVGTKSGSVIGSDGRHMAGGHQGEERQAEGDTSGPRDDNKDPVRSTPKSKARLHNSSWREKNDLDR